MVYHRYTVEELEEEVRPARRTTPLGPSGHAAGAAGWT